ILPLAPSPTKPNPCTPPISTAGYTRTRSRSVSRRWRPEVPAAVCRRACSHLVDVTIHAVLDPESLARRGSRVIGPQPRINPREIVEDANGADGLVDDVAAAARFDRLRESPHGASLALWVPGSCAYATF